MQDLTNKWKKIIKPHELIVPYLPIEPTNNQDLKCLVPMLHFYLFFPNPMNQWIS